MPNRTAIIIPLGTLLEKADTSIFITNMLQKAALANADFEFTAELKMKAFTLAAEFNLGKILPSFFINEIRNILQLQSMPDDEFWREWNKIIVVGDLKKQLAFLLAISMRENSQFYLISDTNAVHISQIRSACIKMDVNLNNLQKPMLLEQFRLYPSFQLGVNHIDLLKLVVDDIQAKVFNKPKKITLIVGDSNHIVDATERHIKQIQGKALVEWCKKMNVGVQLHQHSLEDTFEQMFKKEHKHTKRFGRM